MGIRENKVETYLKNKVKEVLHGESRKWFSPGYAGVPDQILFIENFPIIFVEVKTMDGKLSPAQKREHERLKKINSTSIITTVYGKKDVDNLIEKIKIEA